MTAFAAAVRAAAPLAGLRGAARAILEVQTAEGAIPWFDDGPWDAWNHGECLMALAVMGEMEAVASGFTYLAATQEASGAWLCGYGNALPMDGRDRIARIAAPKVRDTNFAAYPATALWHHARLSGDLAAARRWWPMARAGLDFAVACQHGEGDISWCGEAHGGPDDDAVLAGCASIHASLGCGLRLAEAIGDPQPAWQVAQRRLGAALLARPERFDRRGADRSGFAMDWYYPVLAGALGAGEGAGRIDRDWSRFVEAGRGCRCVDSEPWATVAESAELAMALVRLGRRREAADLLDWQDAHRDADGAWWMGWQFAEAIPWPLEKPAWTQAAMILARDALHDLSPASLVLCGD
jgi:hypothetical protein